jgi:cytochrome oxidase Cu insertion factor (SCO1/SenC/PrrC family)
MVAIFGLGAATVAFLLFGPGVAPWADTLLTACFGWNADTRRYRLDALILTLLQPPLFAVVVWAFYADELRAFLARRGGRVVAVTAPAVFVALAASLLVTGEISASGAAPTPADLMSPLRQGRPAPEFALTDHRGQPVSLASLRGRPVVVTFVYADCHASCPLLIARLKALDARSAPDVAFIAISLDPQRDTPASLAGAAVRWELGSRWHLLSGAPASVKDTLSAYGVQYAPLPDGEIAHENLVLIVDRRGRLAFTYRGLAHPEDLQAADLARLSAERG